MLDSNVITNKYTSVFIFVLTFTVFSYITSIVHAQYLEKITAYFANNRNPNYSFINFIKSNNTSLPLLPFNILINILILSFVSAVVYIMFLTLFTKNNAINKPNLNNKPTPSLSSTAPLSTAPSTQKDLTASKLFDIGSKYFKKGGANNQLQSNLYQNYLKSLSDFKVPYNIFKWFVYVIIFNLLYFLAFVILINTNAISKKKLKEELYVKSLVHYYITGFYISSSMIFIFVAINS